MTATFVSTRGGAPAVGFAAALFAGLAPDGGLYVPATIPRRRFADWRDAPLGDLGVEMMQPLIGRAIERAALSRLLTDALDFPVPVVALDERDAVVELFHGPTFAFKDVGARVMARLMAHLNPADAPLTVLVATSGDTGSAVAQAFYGLSGARVFVLFPEDGVTPVQAAQFTTLGSNVAALAVRGTFDDCQRLVKAAFADAALATQARLTSANSINIGRLLPQMFYYAMTALASPAPPVIVVPTGNVGNLTAGVMSQLMGAPIAGFVAATTVNDTLPRFLASGRYEPRRSVPTLANAMDVGDPSNVERLRWLLNDDLPRLRALITASVHTDADVRTAIAAVDRRYGYVCDPHTAIAWLGLDAAPAAHSRLALATAHPAKFRETVEPIIGRAVPLPAPLAAALARPSLAVSMAPELSELRARLLD